MIIDLSIRPNQIKEGQVRMQVESENCLPYTAAYIGAYTYCGKLQVDNGVEFSVGNNRIYYNLQIGKFNSIGKDLKCVFGRNHNFRNISTGAIQLILKENQIKVAENPTFNNKGSIIVQNDVWFGENVTIMPGVIIRNGAVIARNSHVVSDVPPYAIVGGNPAKIIGYRYSPEQIAKLQTISWWDWDNERIIENASYFTEDVEAFCEAFYEDAKQEFAEYADRRNIEKDAYFMFVDYYENYGDYSKVLTEFLDTYRADDGKQIFLFVQENSGVDGMTDELYGAISTIVDGINADSTISCSVKLLRGTVEDARECFLHCSHYITTRTYDTVYFSCLADKLNMEIISGVDSKIQFVKRQNMYRS